MTRISILAIILCLSYSKLEAQNLPQQYPGLHGYLASYSNTPPAEYNEGFGFYSVNGEIRWVANLIMFLELQLALFKNSL
jgi:hypothetical protein